VSLFRGLVVVVEGAGRVVVVVGFGLTVVVVDFVGAVARLAVVVVGASGASDWKAVSVAPPRSPESSMGRTYVSGVSEAAATARSAKGSDRVARDTDRCDRSADAVAARVVRGPAGPCLAKKRAGTSNTLAHSASATRQRLPTPSLSLRTPPFP